MKTVLTHKTRLGTVGACLALALVGLAIAASSAFTSDPHELGGAAQLSVAATKSFEVLRRPGNAGELDKVAAYIGQQEVDPSSVHLAQSTSAFEVRVAGNAQSVCLVSRIPNLADTDSCSTIVSASNEATPLIQAGWAPEGKLLVTALFPDGTQNVLITSPNGVSTPVAVVNNTIGVLANADDTIHWTAQDGKQFSSDVPH
jgi:hypothetical protein